MYKKVMATAALFGLAAALMLGSCKGGGQTGVQPADTVAGVAATGAPIVGVVHIKDTSTPSREFSGPTGNNGSFSFNVAGMRPPFILKVEWTAAGGTQSLYSFATAPGIANITPLSHVIVANAAGGEDIGAIYAAATPAGLNRISDALAASTSSLQTQLKPLFDQYGVNFNPITGSFAANHTGLDAMLDAVNVAIDGTGNVAVTNKATGSMIFKAPVQNFSAGTGISLSALPMATPSPVAASSGTAAATGTTSTTSPGASTATTPASAAAPDGAVLYASNCAICHGSLASSLKRGTSAARIQSAIDNNSGGMNSLATLNSSQVQAIAAALNGNASKGPTATLSTAGTTTAAQQSAMPDGAALYATYCASCHNALSSSSKTGATAARIQAGIGAVASMGSLSSLNSAQIQAIAGALGGAAASATTPVPAPIPPSISTVDGAALYASFCAGCHGSLAGSSKAGATAARIQAGIGSAAAMGSLTNLSAAQIQAIATALGGGSASPPPPTVPTPSTASDGAALYASYCAGCHGPLATSSKQGTTLSRVQSAIGGISQMTALSSLTPAQLQSIVATLAGAPAPPPASSPTPAPAADGATLYATYCAGCHGTLAGSTKLGATLARIQAGIAGASAMQSLTSLTAAQLQAIAGALSSTTSTQPAPPPPTADGTALYASYCANCHGALSTSSKLGATLARIQTGIAGVSAMQSLASLTAAQLQAIANVLASGTAPAPTPAAGDGAALYATYCASCHGALASSAKAGATVSRIQTAIASNTGGMGSLSTLSSTQLTVIATALATVTPPATPTPACGSCHAIPPATGRHAKHSSERVSCATCHGTGYSTTTFNAATHNNGVYNLATTIGWNATARTCSNSCHGKQTWSSAPTPVSTPTSAPTPTPVPAPDGAALYTTYCAGCHGALATSGKRGATLARIQSGIAGASAMQSLSSLTTAQIQSIATVLQQASSGGRR